MFLATNIGASRGPADDFWFSSVGVGALAGVPVSADSAMRLSTVYKCVRVRAETIGMLPLMVYRRLPDGGKERATDHWAYRLLHDQPNPWMTAMGLRAMMQAHLDLRGNAYAQIVTDGAGRVDMLLPLHPDKMQLEVTASGAPRYTYTMPDGTRRVYVFGELLHVASLSLDGYQGMNPIEAEREAIGAAIAARDYGARYFANSARPPMWIKMAGKFASAEDRRKYASDFAAGFGGMNSGRIPVMEDGKELQAIQVNNSDAQFLELRKYSDVDIAGLFRMPPHKIGILDRATWGNIEHQQLDFSTDTIMPSCIAWEQALLRDLGIGDDGIHYAEHKLDVLLRGDTRTRFEAYGKGIQDGWLTRNEARSMENLNPLDGLDAPLQPLNMQPVGAAPAQLPEPPPAAASASVPAVSGERMVALLTATADRVARKELAMFRAGDAATVEHGRWVAEVMGAPALDAAAYAADLQAVFERTRLNAGRMTGEDFTTARAAYIIRLGA